MMTLIEKAFLLKKTSVFKTLDLDLLLPIADRLTMQKVSPNEIIFDVNDQAYSLYIIAEGFIEIGNATLERGDLFGEESLFNNSPRSYRAITKALSVLLTLSCNDLMTILYEYPKAAIGFLEAYATTLPCRQRQTTITTPTT